MIHINPQNTMMKTDNRDGGHGSHMQEAQNDTGQNSREARSHAAFKRLIIARDMMLVPTEADMLRISVAIWMMISMALNIWCHVASASSKEDTSKRRAKA